MSDMAVLEGVLERITYANEENGYTVARVDTEHGGVADRDGGVAAGDFEAFAVSGRGRGTRSPRSQPRLRGR